MAIVQISKIQHRRGKKNQGPGLPQLASGELGWAIDSQELYIGNGSVSEGAPAVGNTRILTENDITGAGDLNLFDLVLYTYKKDLSLLPYARPLQSRLDDNVSVRSFGVQTPDSSNEIDGTNLQLAIDKLFFNETTKGTSYAGVELVIPEGVYVVSEPLIIPPYTTLRGAGKDKTIIKNTGTGPVFYTVDSNYDAVSTSYQTQSRNLHISGITFEGVAGQPVAVLNSTRDSLFKDVKFKGQWSNGVLIDAEKGISLVATSQAVSCQNNTFDGYVIEGVSRGIDSTTDIHHNTFTNGNITLCGAGIVFGYEVDGKSTGAKLYGPSYNKILNTTFSYITEKGIDISLDELLYSPDSNNPGAPLIGNLSQGNTFINVGTGTEDSTGSEFSIIHFGRSGNLSENDFFDRSVELGSDSNNFSLPYSSEYTGSIIGSHKYNTTISVGYSTTPETLFRLSTTTSSSSRYRVYYVYQSTIASVVRQGVLSLTIDNTNSTVHLSDEYDIVGNVNVAENLTLSAEIDVDEVSLNVNYTNLTAGDTGSFKYWYEIIS